MSRDESVYKELFAELENYRKNGVSILMEDCKASPMQIVTACMLKEEGSYMRDYVLNPEGKHRIFGFYQYQRKQIDMEYPFTCWTK